MMAMTMRITSERLPQAIAAFGARRVLFVGSIGAGKTTLATPIARNLGVPYVGIDAFRWRHGDGTWDGETKALLAFSGAWNLPGVFDATGTGPLGQFIRRQQSLQPVDLVVRVHADAAVARCRVDGRAERAPAPWKPRAPQVAIAMMNAELDEFVGAGATQWDGTPVWHVWTTGPSQ